MWPLAKYVLENYLPHASSATGQVAVYLLFALAGAGILLGFASAFAGISSFVERRVAARMMSRVGPNRVGPQGLLQFMADGLKLVLKEDLIPVGANRLLFRIAPYFVFAGMFGTFVALPFSARLVAANLDVGILYILSITALVVVGIILGGWSSNSKWSLFGGLRSAAQIISYEIPAGLAVLVVVLHAGGLSTQGIIEAQGGMPWNWFIFYSPFSLIAFPVYFTAALAEGNRTPFDLPEAESELVAGYSTEYSGFRFVVFFFAEWANLWIMSAIAVLCFFGGWRIPFVSVAETYADVVLDPAGAGDFLPQDARDGLPGDPASLDASPAARGPDDEHVLEVPHPDRVRLHPGDDDVGRLRRPGHDVRKSDPSRPFRGRRGNRGPPARADCVQLHGRPRQLHEADRATVVVPAVPAAVGGISEVRKNI